MPDRYRVILSPRIAAQLEEIFEYIAKDSPQNASAMVDRILRAMEALATFPHRQIVEREGAAVKSSIRSLPVRPYIVLFRVSDDSDAVHILQVIHSARRRPKNI